MRSRAAPRSWSSSDQPQPCFPGRDSAHTGERHFPREPDRADGTFSVSNLAGSVRSGGTDRAQRLTRRSKVEVGRPEFRARLRWLPSRRTDGDRLAPQGILLPPVIGNVRDELTELPRRSSFYCFIASCLSPIRSPSILILPNQCDVQSTTQVVYLSMVDNNTNMRAGSSGAQRGCARGDSGFNSSPISSMRIRNFVRWCSGERDHESGTNSLRYSFAIPGANLRRELLRQQQDG